MKRVNKVLALILVLVLSLGVLSACSKKDEGKDNGSDDDTPLVVGYLPFSERFSPFFATTSYDRDVADITGVSLLTTDRTGAIIYNSIEGETVNYNGTDYTYTGISDISVDIDKESNKTTYDITIRDDIKFSDGEILDADDIIFTYYVLADTAYDGSSTLYSQPIVGMQNYRANSSIADTITEDEINAYLEESSEALEKALAEEIVKPVLEEEYAWVGSLYENEAYADYTEEYPEQKDLYAFFFSLDEEYDSTDVEEEQVVKDIIAQYGSNYKELGNAYAGDEAYFASDAKAIARDIITEEKRAAGEGEEVPNIEGITKISDTQVRVVTEGYDATAIYQIGGITVAPLHYYGDEELYDYENNQFGFPRGDLSIVKEKTTKPMGAGPYKFVRYENKVVFFEANEHYYKGEPKTKYMQWRESSEADKVTGVEQGTIDITDPTGSKTVFEQIASINDNGELSGNKIVTNTVDFLGYGYIGINSSIVNVGGESDSDASKNLRRALATVLSVYRDVAIDTYYGDAASVINYPISNTSWAAPQPSDSDYEIAFSKDVEGNSIYTADMTSDQRYEAAIEAALGFFEAAGYTVENGKVTAAPEGAKMEYEILIPGDGDGNHPSFAILADASAAFEGIGFNLAINDLTDANVLWDRLDAGTQELWCAAWGATIDPDMYQIYYSTNVVGKGGTDSNHYQITDSDLDTIIMEARQSDDQTYRKAAYKQALDIIIDWAVEIPTYQRQNSVIFSAERVNMDTVTPDITTFYGWLNEIENIKIK